MTVAGTYDIVSKTPMGDQKGQFTVNVSGDSFTGKVTNPMSEMEVQNGKVEGSKLTWTMDMKVPMPMTLKCEATVDGDAISGTIKAGVFGSMEMKGTRAG